MMLVTLMMLIMLATLITLVMLTIPAGNAVSLAGQQGTQLLHQAAASN